MRSALIIAGLMLAAATATAVGEEAAVTEAAKTDAATTAGDQPKAPAKTVCELIEEAAAVHRIPVGFFTRLIWRESSFRAEAVSPKGAEGIAQFMPGTAALRRLADPFDPVAAIPASADYLGDLVARFGNLGRAAAAYNAGEQRGADWLAGAGGLPWETRDYVFAITGRTAADWAAPAPEPIAGATPLPPEKPEPESCVELAAVLARPGAGSQMVSTEPVAQAPWAPWGVQVAGNFSLNRAMASYAALQRRHPAILAGQLPLVVRAVNRSRGRALLFQIRVPADTRDAAGALCRKLQAAGGACVVFRN